jgi:GT2 family glycosyltransferase
VNITVIIPTYGRPDCIRRNMTALAAQVPSPAQIIVVDASIDDRTQQEMASFPKVLYLRNALGRGNCPHSRNVGLQHATGDIIAFLDDDAFVHPGWAAALLDSYSDPNVAGVAGRALNGMPGEERFGIDAIGKILPDGTLTGNFAADPGKVIEVDHMIGCNMSFRREVIFRIGGFRDDVPAGPFGICEDTEPCVRASRLGYRFVFNPKACADHIGAPQPGGRRFSPLYSYYHAKNNLVMIVRNYGVGSMALRHIWSVATRNLFESIRKIGGAVARLVYSVTGLASGLLVGVKYLLKTGRDPIRRDGPVSDANHKHEAERSAVDAAASNNVGRMPVESPLI